MKSIGDWRYFDEELNLIYPWYTSPFLERLRDWDMSNWKVFEYGCGDSTLWWRKKAKEVISIDSNEEWSKKTNVNFTKDKNEFITYPKQFINDGLFDCIIIDGEPIEWRDECVSTALECLKEGGILIIDNYLQDSVDLGRWPIANDVLKDIDYEIFKEPEHVDWKTAFWVKK